MKSLLPLLALSLLPAAADAASTNYARAINNDDGSVTLIAPQFSYQGVSRPLAVKEKPNDEDDLDFPGMGACQLYGFMRFQDAEIQLASWDYYPSIDPMGKFEGLVKTNRVFSVITCGGYGNKIPSTRFQDAIQNDDGSYTIIGPRFKYIDHEYAIARDKSESASFEGAGVCRLFGLNRFHAAELAHAPSLSQDHPKIDLFGEFDGMVHALRVYSAITCSY